MSGVRRGLMAAVVVALLAGALGGSFTAGVGMEARRPRVGRSPVEAVAARVSTTPPDRVQVTWTPAPSTTHPHTAAAPLSGTPASDPDATMTTAPTTTVHTATPVPPARAAAPPGTTAVTGSRGNPFAAGALHRPAWSPAGEQADAWRPANPDGAALLDKIASQPTAVWLGGWSGNITAAVSRVTSQARGQGTVPTLVAYNIPQRDCSGHSGGGAGSAAAYRSWIEDFAAGLGPGPVAVVLEPDALALLDCLSRSGRQERLGLLGHAVSTLGAAGASVYVDAGHARWHPPDETAGRLRAVSIEGARGFALNVSNFVALDETVRYGARVSELLGGVPFVVDTSRNGLGADPSGQWCNPPGRALGAPPAVAPAPSVDAYLWVKVPGESDGECNGGPAAGVFWTDYAVGLAERASW